MEEYILNYSPTVMFRGTLKTLKSAKFYMNNHKLWFSNPSFQYNVIDLRYFKLWILLDQIWNIKHEQLVSKDIENLKVETVAKT